MQNEATFLKDNRDALKNFRTTEEAAQQLVQIMGTPEQQRQMLLETLHTCKARRLIQQYTREIIQAEIAICMESELYKQKEDLMRVIALEFDDLKTRMKEWSPGAENVKVSSVRKDSFHSLAEIRDIIIKNIDAIQSYFEGRRVPLSALIDHLRIYTKLRPGDNKILPNNSIRWNKQVSNAIKKQDWPKSPFKLVSRGHYEIEYWKSAP